MKSTRKELAVRYPAIEKTLARLVPIDYDFKKKQYISKGALLHGRELQRLAKLQGAEYQMLSLIIKAGYYDGTQ